MTQQPNNPLHGLTLETILTQLVEQYGWDELSQRININCFKSDPSIKSSLKFLRKTEWARAKVEELYIKTFTGSAAPVTSPVAKSASRPVSRSKPSTTSSAKPAPSPWAKHDPKK